jgi:serine/threonine-protein kinase
LSKEENWREIEELFFTAEALDSEARASLLAERCAGREALRREVERLLAAAESGRDVVAEAIGKAAAAIQGAGLRAPGDRLGAYHLVEVLGEGGMGTVFLAERADGEFEQRVAVKVIRAGLARDTRWRFLQERQILARLRHPAVARLLDGGTTDDGLPYLVMEYVEGTSIDRYCDSYQLPIRRRLELFREVCAAVQDAHASLVVHRDLKPSNILVTEAGLPKLLDFGIAKLLSPSPLAAATETAFGHRVLTPDYASPEQLRDEPITTAVDVYALGLLLHRLLTGTRPYPMTPSSSEELRRVVCEVDAERPSRAVRKLLDRSAGREDEAQAVAAARSATPGQLVTSLAGDLDHIVAKALRKRPRDRYGSVEQLSADVGRYLEGRPVEARQGGLRYRAGRFVRRHRTAMIATSAAVLTLILGLVGQAREARRANREAAVSARVVAFLTELFAASDPYQSSEQTTVVELLHRAAERVESELEEQPEVQARLMSALGHVYHNRGHFREALPLLEGALGRHRATLPAGHVEIANAELALADDLRVLGRLDESRPHYDRALELRRRLFGEDSVPTAEVLNNAALGLMRGADPASAEPYLRKAFEIRRRELGDAYPTAQTLHNLALLARRQGEYARAIALAREALATKKKILPENHPSVGRTLFVLAVSLKGAEDYAEADQVMRRSLEIMRGVWGDEHRDVLAARGDLAELRHLQGDIEAAEEEQRQVLAAKLEYLGELRDETALTLVALAGQVGDQGRHDEAAALLERALRIRRQILDAEHPTIGRTLRLLAEEHWRAGHVEESVRLAREALRLLQAGLNAGHPDIEKGRRTLEACLAGA